MARIQNLFFKCTPALQATFSAPERWFTTIGADFYLKLPVDPDKYKRTENRQGSKLEGYIDIGDVSISTLSTARVGFEVSIMDQHADLYYMVQKLAMDCTSPDLQTHTPLVVLDFVGPELSDRLAAGNSSFHTVRKGKVVELPPNAGNVSGKGSTLYGKGFAIKFVEQGRRRVLS